MAVAREGAEGRGMSREATVQYFSSSSTFKTSAFLPHTSPFLPSLPSLPSLVAIATAEYCSGVEHEEGRERKSEDARRTTPSQSASCCSLRRFVTRFTLPQRTKSDSYISHSSTSFLKLDFLKFGFLEFDLYMTEGE